MPARWSCRRPESARRSKDIYELPLGGTAVGSGINAPLRDSPERPSRSLPRQTGLPFREAQNHFEAQAARDAAVFLSGALKSYAIALTKIANDIRWLGSGPRCGLGELQLPEVQPGSSIMPGKVNPVIAESVLMVCAQVIGHDATIGWGAGCGHVRTQHHDAGHRLRPARIDRTVGRDFAEFRGAVHRRNGVRTKRI